MPSLRQALGERGETGGGPAFRRPVGRATGHEQGIGLRQVQRRIIGDETEIRCRHRLDPGERELGCFVLRDVERAVQRRPVAVTAPGHHADPLRRAAGE